MIEAAARVLKALDACDGPRGVFSCVGPHDGRCPKSRSLDGKSWRGEWVCKCGREELDAAVATLRAAGKAPDA